MMDNILEIARDLMRENGVAALSLNEIARRLGMKTPSLYVYFENKMALYDALFLRGIQLFAGRMAAVTGTSGPVMERLRRFMEEYMAFAIENADLYQLLFERPVPGFAPSEESMAASLAALQSARDQVAQAIQAGELATGLSPDAATDLAIAMSHGLTALHMANEPHLPLGEGRFGSLIPPAAALFEVAWRMEE
jgi:AcrR family transcriptional regulator